MPTASPVEQNAQTPSHATAARPASGRNRAPTHSLAERHEALVLHLEALQKSVAVIAAKHPAAPLSEATRVLAEGLLFDCAPFLSRPSGAKFPVAAPDHAGLLVQLGQALAGLAAYEARHAAWDGHRQGFVWRLANGHALPVARLRQPLARKPDPTVVATIGVMKRSLLSIAQRQEKRRLAADVDEQRQG